MSDDLRPTPKHTDLLFAFWDPEAHRYVLKTSKEWTPGLCWALRCRHALSPGDGYFCGKCRKRISRVNNPIADRVSAIKQRARDRDQICTLTPSLLEKALKDAGEWEDFMYDPDAYHIDRKDCRKGYVPGNVRILSPSENCSKGARIDRPRHKSENLQIDDLFAEIDDPF